jgi:hypothetical protein
MSRKMLQETTSKWCVHTTYCGDGYFWMNNTLLITYPTYICLYVLDHKNSILSTYIKQLQSGGPSHDEFSFLLIFFRCVEVQYKCIYKFCANIVHT